MLTQILLHNVNSHPLSEDRWQMSELPDICHLISDPRSLIPGILSLAGGVDRDRTDDLKLAKLALSQLSYDPFQMPDAG